MNSGKEQTQAAGSQTRRSEFVRLPGLFRRWEIEQVIDPGADFHIEEAGTCCDGTALLSIYRRDPLVEDEASGHEP